ncbi:hypothetical protein [Mesorhizobium sp. M7A.F.Ca.CA.002.12.1.1]|uniref:hypothetical protein n=1 Tax=Mesorhizobium sp. M7A.F.Ca.CA.002.12.1.1 TaxID=2496735 RepID=UPI000FCB24F6|nr:hypothetical protein [Mesorhizobium sp. M7A.F.Ca.CA.002.12.1.1]RUX60143.1 hypothetical protein EN989_11020 [Mesorhizobium sp. M7A.F.Ca.CA.002.12.1.1]
MSVLELDGFNMIEADHTIDHEWDLAIAEISTWLRATKQIAFTPRSGKAFIVHPKPVRFRRIKANQR